MASMESVFFSVILAFIVIINVFSRFGLIQLFQVLNDYLLGGFRVRYPITRSSMQ